MCGRVVGYQYTSPDAIDTVYGKGHNDINTHYVDGISLTYGSPCQHTWTFMAGINEHSTACPCTNGTTQTVQSFIGGDYFCEFGNPSNSWQYKLFSGMVKAVILLNKLVVKLLVSHGSTMSLTLPLLTVLRCGFVGIKIHMMGCPVDYYDIYVK